MLPARFHLLVAIECLKHKKSLLTASYICDQMDKLDDEVKSLGIIFIVKDKILSYLHSLSESEVVRKCSE